VIDLACCELSLRTNDSPDEARGSEHFGIRAGKPVFLTCAAEIWNVGKHPRLHTELRRSGDDGSYDLTYAVVSYRTHGGQMKEIDLLQNIVRGGIFM
jgi:hypothetical protein